MANVLVTGANQGIGYHLVRQLLADGNRVAALDVETDVLENLARQYPGGLYVYCCDVQEEAAVQQAVKAAAGVLKTIEIAVHNACRCAFLPFETADDALYRQVLEVNLFGAIHLARAVLPHMLEQGGGRVIFTSSGVGVTGFAGISPYAASKGAMESLARCLDLEYRDRGITFHLFHPPLTRTRSSAPLPVPQEFMALPEQVGAGLAKHIHAKGFVICHSRMQRLQMGLCYLWPTAMGRLMCKMTARAQNLPQT